MTSKILIFTACFKVYFNEDYVSIFSNWKKNEYQGKEGTTTLGALEGSFKSSFKVLEDANIYGKFVLEKAKTGHITGFHNEV